MKNLTINIAVMTIVVIMQGSCSSRQGTTTIAGFEMIRVEGGTFNMGDRTLDEGEADEKPVHSVTLNNFYIGKTEVTQKQWFDIMGFIPQYMMFGKGDDYPVYNVNRNDIQVFFKRLEKKTGKKFRLPTESEWEYACRGGKYSANYKYSGSNELNTVAWYCANSGKMRLKDKEQIYNSLRKNKCATHPVGKHKPNELGIYDMSGNVWEWCSDLYDDYPSSPQKNPDEEAKGHEYVIRGGGFADISRTCRISNRGKTHYYTHTCDLGFRLAFSE